MVGPSPPAPTQWAWSVPGRRRTFVDKSPEGSHQPSSQPSPHSSPCTPEKEVWDSLAGSEILYTGAVHEVYNLPQSQAAASYAAILRMISENELEPGSIVTEAGLVRRLGASRTPVREALHRLEAEGHLISGTGRGYLIAELGEDDLIKVYRVRALLEGAAAYDACEVISHAEIGRLKDLYDAMEKAREKLDDRELAMLNQQFHRAIAEASGNRYLDMCLRKIYAVFDRFRTRALEEPGRREAAAHEHGEMIRLLEQRKKDEARELAERHVWGALEVRRRIIKRAADAEK